MDLYTEIDGTYDYDRLDEMELELMLDEAEQRRKDKEAADRYFEQWWNRI